MDPDPRILTTDLRTRILLFPSVPVADKMPLKKYESGLRRINKKLWFGIAQLWPMLWIRDILIWIRIRWSVSLTYGPGSGSCSFRQWLARCQQKISFFQSFFAYNFLKVHLHQPSKIKNQKIVEIKVSLLFFDCWLKDLGDPKINGSGSTTLSVTVLFFLVAVSSFVTYDF